MPKTIAGKLALALFAGLVALALVVGVTFSALFRQHTLEAAKKEMQRQADVVQSLLFPAGEDWQADVAQPGQGRMRGPGAGGMPGRMSNYKRYLTALKNQAGIDIWIIDSGQVLTTGRADSLAFGDLLPQAQAMAAQVLTGQTAYAEGLRPLGEASSLMGGFPIFENGAVAGAMIVQAPVGGMQEAQQQGLRMLAISLVAGMALAAGITLLMIRLTSRPLGRIRTAALRIASGQYGITTGVKQTDEIGEMAHAIDTLSQRLLAAQQETSQTERLRREFMANVSHELKTPVTVLRGSLEALIDGVVQQPDEVKIYHVQMLGETKLLERLISDQLDLSKLQNPDFAIAMELCSLRDILSDAVGGARPLAQEKDIRITAQLEAAAPAIYGDYGRLKQMFAIVLSNALKYSPSGSQVSVLAQGQTVSIRDQGVGISAQDLLHIFERFYRVPSSAAAEGSGLGLAIAKQIAQRHNIDIQVKSAPGQGAEFIFTLPDSSAATARQQ